MKSIKAGDAFERRFLWLFICPILFFECDLMESSEKEIHPNILKALSISFGKDDLAAIRKFLEESQCEIDDVYRGICPQTNGKTTTNNIWRGCVDEISCVTQKERKLDEDYRLEQSLKKKRRKNSGRRRKIEICKCNYNPVS